MATVTYKCNICDRDIDLLENSNGLTTFSKCVITYGCKGKLLKTKRNPDNIREKFPSEVPGLEDYSQRRVLFNYTQNLPNNVWVIDHDLGTNPSTSIYVYDATNKLVKLDPDQYNLLFVNKNQIRVTFDNFYNGKAQLVSRSSIKLTPQMVANDVALFQVTAEGYFTFAVPKYLTKFQYPPSLLPTPTLPYKLDDTPIRIEVSIKKPNEEEELCTEYLSNSLTEVPWAGWNEILVRRRRNYYLFSKSILDFRTLGGDTLKFSDIPTGTQLKITRIDYGTGVLQPIPPEGLYIMLATTPFTSNDKVKDKVIDVANMVDNDIDYFSYNSTDFFVDPTNVEKTYPDVLMVKPVNFIPPAPSVTPTISPTHSLTPSMSPSATIVVSSTPLATPTPTPTVTRSLTTTPSPTPTITPSSTPGSFNQPFDYALVRYTWTPSDGTDLDTRTAIIDPPRNTDVGWSRANNDGVYLTWGGDNTSPSGPEAVLIDFNQLSADYTQEDFTIRLRLNWYGQRVSGNVGVQFQSFLGGTMQHSGTDFVNVGGLLVNDATVFVNCTSNTAGNVDGSDIGTLVYDSTNKTAQFFPLVPAVTPTPTVTTSLTASVTPSITPTISVTPSITPTISLTPTISPTISVTPSVSVGVSVTPTISPTISITPYVTPTISITPTISLTPSITASITPSVTISVPIASTYEAAVLQDSPVGYWKLDEASGTFMNDSSGNGHSGVYSTSSNLKLGSNPIRSGSLGCIDVLAVETNLANVPSITEISSSFTLESIININGGANHKIIFGGEWDTSGAGTALWYNGGQLQGRIYINDVVSPNTNTLNTTLHVAFTHDATTGLTSLYENGVLVNSVTINETPSLKGILNIMGRQVYQDIPTGFGSDFAYYDKALSGARIKVHSDLALQAFTPTPTISVTPSPTPTPTPGLVSARFRRLRMYSRDAAPSGTSDSEKGFAGLQGGGGGFFDYANNQIVPTSFSGTTPYNNSNPFALCSYNTSDFVGWQIDPSTTVFATPIDIIADFGSPVVVTSLKFAAGTDNPAPYYARNPFKFDVAYSNVGGTNESDWVTTNTYDNVIWGPSEIKTFTIQ